VENFIVAYHNAYPKEYCNQIIDWFDQAVASGLGVTRQELDKVPKYVKEDITVFPFSESALRFGACGNLCNEFLGSFFNKYYFDYASRFPILETTGSHTIYELRVQKTLPGGGYHAWHCEVDNRNNGCRLVAFTLYLNDITEGGETEFLYQGVRVKPEQGTLVLWPAGFTHTHRGNPPLKETKYIVTGWVEFT
jgi:hypothetical protein